MGNMAQGDSVRNGNSPFVLLLEDNVGWLLVDAYAKTFQFSLDDLLVSQGLVDVQNNENEMACLRYSYDLTTSALTVLGPLNDAR